MELYDKLNILEEKLDKIVAEIAQARSEKAKIQAEYDELSMRFASMETELEQVRKDKDAVREKIENLLNKLG